MSEPYVGEIRIFAGNFAPSGWMFCSGQLLSIPSYSTLFSLIGTTYGGNGTSTFALPDLRGRVPIHMGQGPGFSNYVIGQNGGAEQVTLTLDQIPSHTHIPIGNSTGGSNNPSNNYWASSNAKAYSAGPGNTTMNGSAIGSAGGSQPHDNMLPFLGLNFIISLLGIFPSQT